MLGIRCRRHLLRCEASGGPIPQTAPNNGTILKNIKHDFKRLSVILLKFNFLSLSNFKCY